MIEHMETLPKKQKTGLKDRFLSKGSARNHGRLLAFRHRLEAACADVLADLATVDEDRRPLYIRLELPLRLFLREAYVMARHRPLATDFTFRHNFTLS